MDPAIAVLKHDLGSRDDEAYDSAVDAILVYLDDPSIFDPRKGRLSTYLVAIAKRKAIDRLRSRAAERRREIAFAEIVELQAVDPNNEMQVSIEARQLWQMVEQRVESESDRKALKLILAGERSTDVLAEAMGISCTSDETQTEVKRNRDRLLKILERLGTELGNDRKS